MVGFPALGSDLMGLLGMCGNKNFFSGARNGDGFGADVGVKHGIDEHDTNETFDMEPSHAKGTRISGTNAPGGSRHGVVDILSLRRVTASARMSTSSTASTTLAWMPLGGSARHRREFLP